MLKKGKNYTININNTASASDFTITISQDNWVYAPNGGIRTGVQHIYNRNNKIETYLTADTVYEIIKGQRLEDGQAAYKSITVEELFNEKGFNLTNSVQEFSVYLLRGFELGNDNANEIFETIEDFTDTSGIAMILNEETQLFEGIIVTAFDHFLNVVDIGLFIVSLYEKEQEKNINELKSALINGKLNICISSYLDDTVDYSEWNKQNYISKYYETFPLNGYSLTTYRCKEIIQFNSSNQVIINGENGWEVCNEN